MVFTLSSKLVRSVFDVFVLVVVEAVVEMWILSSLEENVSRSLVLVSSVHILGDVVLSSRWL